MLKKPCKKNLTATELHLHFDFILGRWAEISVHLSAQKDVAYMQRGILSLKSGVGNHDVLNSGGDIYAA